MKIINKINTMKCPYCGYDHIQPAFKFCPKCRHSLTEGIQSTEDSHSGEEKILAIAKLKMPYAKAISEPKKYAEWAAKNPNDRKKLWSMWEKEGKDLSPLMKYNPDTAQRRETSIEQPEKVENIIREASATHNASSTAHTSNSAPSSFANNSGQIVKHKAIWSVVPGEIARHISAVEFDEITNNLDGVLIQEGVTAFVYVDGVQVAAMNGGVYTFATQKDYETAKDSVLLKEKADAKGGLPKVVSTIWRFLSGKKEGENAAMAAARKQKVIEAVRNITASSAVDVYLKLNKIFTLPFGVVLSDGKCTFQPYKIKTRILDAEAAATLQVKIGDFKEFIASYLADKSSSTIADIQLSMNNPIRNILTMQMKSVEIDQYGIPEENLESIKGKLMNVGNLLHGVEIVQVESISVDNHDFDRIRTATAELYMSEQELDMMHKTNQFKNRLSSAVNEQKIYEAKDELELKRILDQVNMDGLLQEEEIEKFMNLLKNQKLIREATCKADLDKAMSEIKYNSLVSQDEYDALTEKLDDEKFDRQQLSETMRLQSLSRTALSQLELNQKLSLAKLDVETENQKRQLHAEIEIDDAKFEAFKRQQNRDAESIDLEAAIYGRRFVLEKQKALDEMNLELTRADHRNNLLDKDIEGRQKLDAYKEAVEDREFDRSMSREERSFDFKMKKNSAEYDMQRRAQQDAFNLEDQRAEREQEREIRRMQAEQDALAMKSQLAMQNMKAMQEHEAQMRRDEFLHEEKINEQNTSLEATKINTYKDMSAEAIAATQASNLSADAQKAMMESFGSNKLLQERDRQDAINQAERERRDQERREDQLRQEQNMKEMMQMMQNMAMNSMSATVNAVTGINANQNVANREAMQTVEKVASANMRASSEHAEEYRQQAMYQQERTDKAQDCALNYTTRVTETDSRFAKPAPTPATAPAPAKEYLVPELNNAKYSKDEVMARIQEGMIIPSTVIVKADKEYQAVELVEFQELIMHTYSIQCDTCGETGLMGMPCPHCGNLL